MLWSNFEDNVPAFRRRRFHYDDDSGEEDRMVEEFLLRSSVVNEA